MAETLQISQDFTRILGENFDIEEYLPYLLRLLREIELDVMQGNEDNFSAFRQVLNDLGGEIQEQLNSG